MSGPSELLECSWGSIRLFCSQVHTDSGRTQVVHELSSGDDHPVQDRGLRVRRVRCQLLFDDFPGQAAPKDAALALERAKDLGQTAVFQHPILGRFVASIGEFNQTIDDSSVITAECEFIKEGEDIATLPTGESSGAASGGDAVDAAAELLDGRLADVGLAKMSGPAAAGLLSQLPGGRSLSSSLSPSLSTDLSVSFSPSVSASIAASVTANASASAAATASAQTTAAATAFAGASALAVASAGVGAAAFAGTSVDARARLASMASAEAAAGNFAAVTLDARVAVTSWGLEDTPTRQVLVDTARISNNIAVMIDLGGFEDDLALFPAFQAAIMLGDAVREAARSATSQTSSVFTMRVQERTALLPLVARVYGGANAQLRYDQVMALNDISTPGWLAPGDYLMPVRPPGPAF